MKRESSEDNENFFEKFGLQISSGDVQVGNTYPIYGMITKLIDDTPGAVKVEINYSIQASMTINDVDKIEVLRERAFEPGIFVSKVLSKEDGITVSCTTVVFGKRHGFDA